MDSHKQTELDEKQCISPIEGILTYSLHCNTEVNIIAKFESSRNVLGLRNVKDDLIDHICPLDEAIGFLDGAHDPLIAHGCYGVLQTNVPGREVTGPGGDRTRIVNCADTLNGTSCHKIARSVTSLQPNSLHCRDIAKNNKKLIHL